VFDNSIVLCLSYRFGRADTRARSAIGAFPRIDHVNRVALTDRFNRTFGNTRSAGKASIRDFVSHGEPPWMLLFAVFEKHFFKKGSKKSRENIYHMMVSSTGNSAARMFK
jgi:hypothetical protein